MSLYEPLLATLREQLGAEHVLDGALNDLDQYTVDWRKKFSGRALAVVRPANTAEVAAVVRLCADAQVAIVPQGGNTGICGASVPDGSGTQVVLSLSRMSRVLDIDTGNNTMTVEAGCVLQTIQERAQAAGRLFPLSLGAEGSCQIGGNIATNAGGVQVLRYGNTRDLVLGLEVVLADGQVLDLLRGLRKDNTGYDLKQHFIGSEGTLGIITAATIKLYPAPACTSIAFAGVPSVSHAIELLHAMRAAMGERFAAFELMSRATVDMVMRYFPETPKALQTASPWYILMEAADGGEATVLDAAMEAALGGAIEAGLIEDVALAASSLQAQALWQMRENVAEAQQRDGANIKHDIAVPISMISAFVDEVLPILEQAYPGSRPVVFGHVGDGNLHFNLSAPAGWPIADWQAQTDAVNTLVHDVVTRYRGSISAEHGIGQLKRHELEIYKTPLELAVMWRIKDALDPKGIMNPGKVLPAKLRA